MGTKICHTSECHNISLDILCSHADDCADEPCGDGGVCTDTFFSYSCQCLSGYMLVNNSDSMETCVPIGMAIMLNKLLWQ